PRASIPVGATAAAPRATARRSTAATADSAGTGARTRITAPMPPPATATKGVARTLATAGSGRTPLTARRFDGPSAPMATAPPATTVAPTQADADPSWAPTPPTGTAPTGPTATKAPGPAAKAAAGAAAGAAPDRPRPTAPTRHDIRTPAPISTGT